MAIILMGLGLRAEICADNATNVPNSVLAICVPFIHNSQCANPPRDWPIKIYGATEGINKQVISPVPAKILFSWALDYEDANWLMPTPVFLNDDQSFELYVHDSLDGRILNVTWCH